LDWILELKEKKDFKSIEGGRGKPLDKRKKI